MARLPERVSAMESLLRKQSLDELRHALHQLKGAGGGYGFSTISDRAGQAERLIRDQAQFDAVRDQVQSTDRTGPQRRRIRSHERIRHPQSTTQGNVVPDEKQTHLPVAVQNGSLEMWKPTRQKQNLTLTHYPTS